MKNKKRFTATHLFYLTQIYLGSFDARLRAGRYAGDSELAPALVDLLDAGFVEFDGRHTATNKGKNKVRDFAEGQKDKYLGYLCYLLEIHLGVFNDRLQRGVYAADLDLDNAITYLLETKQARYYGLFEITELGVEAISNHFDVTTS